MWRLCHRGRGREGWGWISATHSSSTVLARRRRTCIVLFRRYPWIWAVKTRRRKQDLRWRRTQATVSAELFHVPVIEMPMRALYIPAWHWPWCMCWPTCLFEGIYDEWDTVVVHVHRAFFTNATSTKGGFSFCTIKLNVSQLMPAWMTPPPSPRPFFMHSTNARCICTSRETSKATKSSWLLSVQWLTWPTPKCSHGNVTAHPQRISSICFFRVELTSHSLPPSDLFLIRGHGQSGTAQQGHVAPCEDTNIWKIIYRQIYLSPYREHMTVTTLLICICILAVQLPISVHEIPTNQSCLCINTF